MFNFERYVIRVNFLIRIFFKGCKLILRVSYGAPGNLLMSQWASKGLYIRITVYMHTHTHIYVYNIYTIVYRMHNVYGNRIRYIILVVNYEYTVRAAST